MSSEHKYIVISPAQTDLGLRSRTFSLKIVSCLHCVTSLKCGKGKIVFKWSDEFTY